MSTRLRVLLSRLALFAGLCGCAACEDELRAPPESYQDACSVDAGECVEPLGCFAVPDHDSPATDAGTKSVCTLECTKDSECPTWENPSGHHCAGLFATKCIDGYCQGQCE